MAIGRLSVTVGKNGKASPHAQYIAREGKYAKPSNHAEKLEYTGHGNMPKWAEHNPNYFWQMADEHERKNGSTYREHVIALPRELDENQRHELVKDWIKNEIGDKHAYQYAIHNPPAMDGGEQPHAHIMFSERLIDDIERDPDQYFKRYNSKNPEKGGAKKANTPKKSADRKAELKAMRDRWEKTCNAHLERAGHYERISMKSLKEQGIDREPVNYTMAQIQQPEIRQAYINELDAKEQEYQAKLDIYRVLEGTPLTEINRQLREQEAERKAKELQKQKDEAVRQFKLEARKHALEREKEHSATQAPPSPVKERTEPNKPPVIKGQTVAEAQEVYSQYDQLVAVTSERMREHYTKQADAKMAELAKQYKELEANMPLMFKGKHKEKMQDVAKQYKEMKNNKKYYQDKDFTMEAKDYIEKKFPEDYAKLEEARRTLHAQASFKYGSREAQAGRTYSGEITAVTRLGIKQTTATGREIYHELDKFDPLPNEGDKLTIRYDSRENALVMQADKAELERQHKQHLEQQNSIDNDRGLER